MSNLCDNKSPEYHLRHWRNIPQEKIDTLEEFLGWYKDYLYDHDENNLTEKSKEMEVLISAFLEYSPKEVQKGENNLLKRWTQGTLKP